VEKNEGKKITNTRLFAFIITGVGFLLLAFSIVTLLQLKLHILIFTGVFLVGFACLSAGLYVLVKTKPEPTVKEEFDEEIPDTDTSFDDWSKQKSVNTFKSERPDPSQYKQKKEYKAFPSQKKDDEDEEDQKDEK
jgi:hypothetical protein